jgi:hypothetical protein
MCLSAPHASSWSCCVQPLSLAIRCGPCAIASWPGAGQSDSAAGTGSRCVSSKGSENLPDRPVPGCCVPGRVPGGVLGAASGRRHFDWSRVWGWRPATRGAHGPGPCPSPVLAFAVTFLPAPVAPTGHGPGGEVHGCGPQPALRQRGRVVPGGGRRDGDQRAYHEDGRPVPDEITTRMTRCVKPSPDCLCRWHAQAATAVWTPSPSFCHVRLRCPRCGCSVPASRAVRAVSGLAELEGAIDCVEGVSLMG